MSRFLTPVPHPYSRGDGEGWLWSLSGLGPDQVVFAIDLEGEGFIGCIAYEGELGYWIAEPFWGRGFATEAARALLDWKFANREVMSLGSGVHVDNVASLRVQEKLGFSIVGRRRVFARARQTEVERLDTEVTRAAFLAACVQLDAATGGVT